MTPARRTVKPRAIIFGTGHTVIGIGRQLHAGESRIFPEELTAVTGAPVLQAQPR
jgi:hypothetical protein